MAVRKKAEQVPAAPAPIQRVTEFSQDAADAICNRIAEGESLRSICSLPPMPQKITVLRWLAASVDFQTQYARAREDQAEHYATEIIEIADDSSHDIVTRTRADGSTYEEVDHDHIARSRLRVDARKWVACKLKPRVYGDKTAITGADGGPAQIHILSFAQSLAVTDESKPK